ncbi:hypothetical protein CVT26_005277, partial [Gymnopilus dilepis]
ERGWQYGVKKAVRLAFIGTGARLTGCSEPGSYYETQLVGCSSPRPYYTETRPSWHRINNEEYSEFSQNPKKLVGQKLTQEGGQEIWEVVGVTLLEEADNRYAVLENEAKERRRMLVDDLMRMLREGEFQVAEIL